MSVSPTFPSQGQPIIGAGTRGTIADQCRPLPQMRSTAAGWFRPMVVIITRQRIVDGENRPSFSQARGAGIIQPLSNEELQFKAEGDRSWKWVLLHCTDQILLQTNDEVEIKGFRYRVMGKQDYQDYGYLRYELIETFAPNQ